jgi:lysophospholipase L1-like esterase
MKKVFFILTLAFLAANNPIFSAITPNPIISRGKTAYTSSGNVLYLTDDRFGTSSFTVSNGSWIALKLDSGYSKIFVNWNNPNYSWSDTIFNPQHSCPESVVCPVNYVIQTSSNSTNGKDGTWITKDSIVGNVVTARGHLIDFKDASWVKMLISKGSGSIDEFEVFDVIDSLTVAQDSWFFVGTSISANTFKGTPPVPDYADNIAKSFPGYNPIMIKGGIPCILSTQLASDISKYLNAAGNVKYWAIEMGTNDAWDNGNSNVATFKSNLQTVINSCKAHGIQPIIANVLATNPKAMAEGSKWQVDTDYYGAVEDLTINNNLISGPDLYSWFLAHPDELNSDGVHPNATGAASIQRLWAQKMASVYGGCSATEITPYVQVNSGSLTKDTTVSLTAGDTLILSPQAPSTGFWSWAGPYGFISASREIKIETIKTTQAGNYIATFINTDSCGIFTFKVSVTNPPSGIASETSSNYVSIFPNPSDGGKFKVLLNNFSGTSQFRIYNMQGKLIYNSVLSNEETEINSKLPQGIYIINIAQKQNIFNKTLTL